MNQRSPSAVRLTACFCLILVGACGMLAQPAGSGEQDEAAIRQAGKGYQEAMQRGDLEKLADFWTSHGLYTDQSGRSISMREALSKAGHTAGTPAATPATCNVAVRFVADNVAIEEGDLLPPEGEDSSEPTAHYTAIWVREGKQWKLDSVRETAIDRGTDPGELASLDILTGQWTGEENNVSIHVSADWDANKKFLTRRITMASGKSSLVGTQMIGWDPLTRQIRSWMFSDDGSYTEGVWSREGNLWMAPMTRALPDGSVSTATQVYKFPDKDTIVWKIVGGAVDGQPTDNCEIVLKRTTEK